MREEDQRSDGIFGYVRLERRVRADHPLRAIRDSGEPALRDLSRDLGLPDAERMWPGRCFVCRQSHTRQMLVRELLKPLI